jgi:hypothetical protein
MKGSTRLEGSNPDKAGPVDTDELREGANQRLHLSTKPRDTQA